MKKRFIALLLAMLLLLTLSLPAFADTEEPTEPEEPITLSNPRETLYYGLREGNGPISITKYVLYMDQQPRPVYLIALTGAGYNPLNHNNFAEFIMSSVSLPTGYLRYVKNAARDIIPQGATVLLIGHSLGGTTAQQFAADKEMRSRYEILNVCTCGSPYIVELNREGSLHRLGEILDIVPVLSLAGPLNLFLDINYELGGFSGQFKLPHETSYYFSSVWDKYDCLGVKGGSAYLVALPSDTLNFTLRMFS